VSHSGPIYQAGEPGPAAAPRMSPRSAGVVKAGASFGTVLAVTISWSVHKSILWAIVHGILSWLYVLWFALTR
jgi:hypothetical protein